MAQTLTQLHEELVESLKDELDGWNVSSQDIAFPSDKLVELVYLDLNSEMVDFGTQAITGNLGVVVYRRFGQSYTEQIDAVETIVRWFRTLNRQELSVGNNTPVLASISSPSIASDGNVEYRVIMVSVAVEIILEEFVQSGE